MSFLESFPWFTHVAKPSTASREDRNTKVVASVLRALHERGWTLHVRGRWLRFLPNWANPFTKRVSVSDLYEDLSGVDFVVLLVHEACHVVQWGKGAKRWWRAVRYFFRSSERVAMETEARAHALVYLRLQFPRAPIVVEAGALAGFRWPYFTGARRTDVEARIRYTYDELMKELGRDA